jgi:hypothetical protein
VSIVDESQGFVILKPKRAGIAESLKSLKVLLEVRDKQ